MKGWSGVYKDDKEKRNTLEEVKTAIASVL